MNQAKAVCSRRGELVSKYSFEDQRIRSGEPPTKVSGASDGVGGFEPKGRMSDASFLIPSFLPVHRVQARLDATGQEAWPAFTIGQSTWTTMHVVNLFNCFLAPRAGLGLLSRCRRSPKLGRNSRKHLKISGWWDTTRWR